MLWHNSLKVSLWTVQPTLVCKYVIYNCLRSLKMEDGPRFHGYDMDMISSVYTGSGVYIL